MKVKFNPEKHHRKSIRLKNYDYAEVGSYFITICTHNRENLFGEIEKGEMILNEFGDIAYQSMAETESIRPNIMVDEFIIMPNHIHAIIIITENFSMQGRIAIRPNDKIRPGDGIHKKDEINQYHNNNDIYHTGMNGRIAIRPANFKSPSQTIGAIARGYKSSVTKQINILRKTSNEPVWQRNFLDKMIRTHKQYLNTKNYIINNPKNFEKDNFYQTIS